MSRALSIPLIVLLYGCSGSSEILHTQFVQCPESPPPTCEEWDFKKKDDFDLNTDLEMDRLEGYKKYEKCRILLEGYTDDYNACSENYSE